MIQHIVIFIAAACWYVLVSVQTVFVAQNKAAALAVNFVTSLVWVVLLRNLLVDLEQFALTYALGTMVGCAVGMRIAHGRRR